jgi:hypothetical protein
MKVFATLAFSREVSLSVEGFEQNTIWENPYQIPFSLYPNLETMPTRIPLVAILLLLQEYVVSR